MGTEHFDDKAATWDDDPDKARQAQDVARAVASAVPTDGATRLLEYGAGTGLVTQALIGRVGPVTLADNSPGMREVLQVKVASGILPRDARVWDLDLETQPVPSERFDLVVSSMVMHHVTQLDVVLAAFAELLEPGGHLCIADLDREDGSFHSHDFGGHHGFDRQELVTALGAAGLAEVTTADCTTISKEGTAYPVFLATARRP
ncbi:MULTISPECIES: class I SAM-dependent DNA methyltransferase [unclassified Ornithinimicrobium]|uniref:class I SAM-dependent DNA methyltransferase n=1 Tax=unclassified Ornithinimicrobium TaxID=2615080 RepID=UPI00385342B2